MKILLSLSLVLLQVAIQHAQELKYRPILDKIRQNAKPDIIPIEENDNKALKVSLSLSLEAVMEADNRTAQLVFRERYLWQDKTLAWNPSKTPSMKNENVSIPLRYVWVPDLTVDETLHMPQKLSPEKAILFSNGTICYEPRKRMRVFAEMDEQNNVNVSFSYRSMTYQINDLEFEEPTNETLTISNYHPIEFDITDPEVRKEIINLPPSESTFSELKFSFVLQPREQSDEN